MLCGRLRGRGIIRTVISIVIPVRNGARTLEACLAAACAASGPGGEVVVVDDGSSDASAAIAARHPCRLVRLPAPRGAAAARNAGAAAARGEVLFFTDADCLAAPDAAARAAAALAAAGERTVLGGTYDPVPADPGFFPAFQAVFVNFHETRRPHRPDYLATHALAIRAADFRASGGFDEGFLPILEDVELSHRLRRAGYRLLIDPNLRVRHDFGFGLAGSLRNAARKTRHWVRYSVRNSDLLADSGTASRGLKTAGALAGLAVGYAVNWVIGRVYPALPVGAPAWAVALAMLIAVASGVVFGLMPARRAARLDPVVALAGRR